MFLEPYNQDAVFIHANAGITFDLDKIRAAYSSAPIKWFRTVCLQYRDKKIYASDHSLKTLDFWILVDGQVRYQKPNVDHSEPPCPIQFPISQQDRFLTLVVTDGREDDLSHDWGYFIEPTLILGND